jgi:hypothetical protein
MKDARFDGTHGTTEYRCDFFVSQSLAETEYQRLSLPIGQLSDIRPQAAAPLGRVQAFIGGRFTGSDARRRLEVLELAAMRSGAASLASFEIQQNSVQPRIDGTLSAEFLPRVSVDQECFLSQVVRIPGIAGQNQCRTMDAREVLANGTFEIEGSACWVQGRSSLHKAVRNEAYSAFPVSPRLNTLLA